MQPQYAVYNWNLIVTTKPGKLGSEDGSNFSRSKITCKRHQVYTGSHTVARLPYEVHCPFVFKALASFLHRRMQPADLDKTLSFISEKCFHQTPGKIYFVPSFYDI